MINLFDKTMSLLSLSMHKTKEHIEQSSQGAEHMHPIQKSIAELSRADHMHRIQGERETMHQIEGERETD